MRNDGYHPLEDFFPNQFKTPFSTLVWTAVYLANGLLLYWLFHRAGLPADERYDGVVILVIVIGAALLFWLEARIYDKIRALFR